MSAEGDIEVDSCDSSPASKVSYLPCFCLQSETHSFICNEMKITFYLIS